MRRLYSRMRVALLTFAFGLAAVWMVNGLSTAWSDVTVDIPHAKSGDVLLIFPADHRGGGGGGGGLSCDFHSKCFTDRVPSHIDRNGQVNATVITARPNLTEPGNRQYRTVAKVGEYDRSAVSVAYSDAAWSASYPGFRRKSGYHLGFNIGRRWRRTV